MVTTAQALTAQFYEWERLGRGWFRAERPVDLEPTFTPFFGHYLAQPVVDDGRRHSLWSALSAWLNGEQPPVREAVHSEPLPVAYESDDAAPLCIYAIFLPRHFKQSAERVEQLLVMLSYRRSAMSFEIVASRDEVSLQWVCREYDADFVCTQIHAFFPDCTVIEADEDRILSLFDEELPLYTVDFGLGEEFMRPMATLQSPDDPYTPLFGILSRLERGQHAVVQVLFSGTHNAWAESILTAVHDDTGRQSFFLDAPEMPQLAREKVARPLLGATVRAMAFADTTAEAGMLLQAVATALVHASRSSGNALAPLSDAAYSIEERIHDILYRVSRRVGMLLNSRELATLVHFPAVPFAKFPSSNRATKMAGDGLTGHDYVLGVNGHRGIDQLVGISTVQRLRHVHVMGATGTGKSTLLKSLMAQDMEAGTGFMCLDPHGDLIEDVLRMVPTDRIGDVVLIDPADAEFPIGLNILEAHSDVERELLASDLVAMFRRFSTSWGDQMNSVFANAILAFLYNGKQYHLGDLRRFLIEAPYRSLVLSTATDPDIAYYWQHEYPILKGGSIGSILTRLDSFLRPKSIRNMVCQAKSLDFAHLMDTGKIVLVKLSQGLLGAENSYLLGAFIVSRLQQTAMSRQVHTAKDRVPFFCYVDEFQHFVTPSMASILSGARKYGLGLVLSHQDMAQVAKYDSEIAGSVLSNAGTRICFRLGDADARRLADGFGAFTAEDLQNLSTGDAIMRVNTGDNDCSLTVLPRETDGDADHTDEIVGHSRATYSVPIMHTAAPVIEPTVVAGPLEPVVKKEITTQSTAKTAQAVARQEQLREHRYLQAFVKSLAEARGYRASIEVPTPDGSGLVDVLLEKGGAAIAVEISVTTTAAWELHNVRKCIDAGYGRVVVCTTQPVKLQQITSLLASQLTRQEQSRVQAVLSADLNSIFAADAAPPPAEALVKGYRVRVKYEPNASRQDLLQGIINAARKP